LQEGPTTSVAVINLPAGHLIGYVLVCYTWATLRSWVMPSAAMSRGELILWLLAPLTTPVGTVLMLAHMLLGDLSAPICPATGETDDAASLGEPSDDQPE
jgi:hypothetical protein